MSRKAVADAPMVCTADPVGAGSDGERMVMAETCVELVRAVVSMSMVVVLTVLPVSDRRDGREVGVVRTA
jgi:hypothetical protein